MYTAEDLREELSYHVKVDADIAGKIDYSRYVMICENYIRANYFGGKNRRLITLDKPVTSIGFYLSAKLKRDCIVFGSHMVLQLYPDEIEAMKDRELTFSIFNQIIRRHAKM